MLPFTKRSSFAEMRWLEKFNLWKLTEALNSRNGDAEVKKISQIFVQPAYADNTGDVRDAADVTDGEENTSRFAKYCQSTT